MDPSQSTLSIESFSYSWLVNIKPSFEGLDNSSSLRASLDASDEASFIEMDPRMPPSKRFCRISQDFKFDFPNSEPSVAVHADELFSNGYLMPLFIDPLKIDTYNSLDSVETLPSSSSSQAHPKISRAHSSSASLRSCKGLSRRIFQKYLDFLRPLYRKLRSCKLSSSRSRKGNTRVHIEKSLVHNSAQISPRISVAYSTDDNWRRSCDSESSIYEAVLHCKRSIGKSWLQIELRN